MPELPTSAELATIIHEKVCGCSDFPDDCDERMDWRVLFLAADAVLHRLMRDADTERETLWSRKQVPVPQVPGERAWGWEMTATERQRLSVTFTGEREPADPS